ncbi:MAG: carbohydrate ABC transporter permease [Acutalibacteraceae bacterium]|nr:carbohydrate ABC transporter permease [Acutalibacteraceae bacterium]
MSVKNFADSKKGGLLSFFFFLLSALWVAPIIIVLYNSLKTNTGITLSPLSFPNGETFAGLNNYINGITHGNYPFYLSLFYSVIITVFSVFLILLCTSMAAWYIVRVNSFFCKLLYYLFVFSMVVPFQMVMFTLSKTADSLSLNTPFTIPFIYLGFGAGLAVFLFSGFIKSIPLEIEEAADIDGCNAVRTFFFVVVPIMKSTYISVAILQMMWVWNDYLLPYLVLDRTKYMTVPIHIQFLQGSFGRVDYGATMALIIICLLPIVILYAFSQKHIIRGVLSGAVKG